MKFAFIKIIHPFIDSEDYIRIVILMKLNIIEKKMLLK